MVKGIIKKQRKSLPIYKYKHKILETINKSQVTILIGETGSGKTTQVAQYILESSLNSDKLIGITQPRRIAAISVAKRVAYERQSEIGSLIGYSVRFENKTSENTKIKFLTDGMLIRESLIDPILRNYSFLIIDEAHERTTNTDIILGLIRELITQRNDIKVIIMSATIEAQRFAEFFSSREIIEVHGRTFPVKILNAAVPEPDHIDATVIGIVQVHLDYPAGDILVFLTGQEEIEDVQAILLRKRKLLPTNSMDFTVCAMYAALPSHLQMKAFESAPENTRKIILATNIAETSLTIPGVKYVIDSGVVKERNYDPRTGMESLKIVKISKAAAKQRAGRAGRESEGICFRLFTSEDFNGFEDYSKPEITRSNLGNVVLQLKIIGHDPRLFKFMDRPDDIYIEKATQELRGLGALDGEEKITLLGRKMAELPVPPVLARILLASLEPQLQCTKDILTIIALLSVENLCYFNRKEANAMQIFKCSEGDHLTFLKIYQEWRKNKTKSWCKTHGLNRISIKRASMIRKQLRQYLKKYNPALVHAPNENILKCLAKGYYMNSAFLSADGTHYRTIKDREIIHIHPTSVLFQTRKKPQCIIFSEVIITTKKYVRGVSEADYGIIQSFLGTLKTK
ncbi:unnamed protein product [Blepharisma stoltei]|uniref:RNA helicase n=1 Tax=Blepharisma stoltei TaxID=1481888 RepID=A0AAU9ICU3_9CILI|nr:unnamed protein product [Blepharisma stoltei]